MGKKSRRRRRARSSPAKNSRSNSSKNRLIQGLENSVLAMLYSTQNGAPSLTDIAQSVLGKRTVGSSLKDAFSSLLHSRAIVKVDKKHFQLSKSAPLYTGTLTQHPRGFGFVKITGKHKNAPEISEDLYVARTRMADAVHGDTVLARLSDGSSKSRPEASIIRVLEHGSDILAGYFVSDAKGDFVYPEDSRYPFIVQVAPVDDPHLQNGNAVIVQIKKTSRKANIIQGTLIEVLGPPENIDVQMRFVIEKFTLPHIFSQQTCREVETLQMPEKVPPNREDLRHLPHITIDGESAKDFDDAVCVTKNQSGYTLFVSIADVSHFVLPGTALDTDAYERGTSIYFPGRVIPMLPEKLSNNLCSLIPDQDRFTVTAILDFDKSGNRTNSRFCRSVINSHQRFTYTTVKQIVIDKDQQTQDKHKSHLPMLSWCQELATLLLKKRKKRGSIGFSLPEPEILLDQDGNISSIKRADRNFAHQIIEEFMLAANEAVASLFSRNKIKALYRIHELPDYTKVTEFSEFAKTLDLHLPPPTVSPEWFGQVLELCQNSPKEYIVNNLLLRTMQQARYSPDNAGHFALAAEDYTHFTSPIRRYPDLLVHRALCQHLDQQQHDQKASQQLLQLREQGTFLSARERAAVTAEREMGDRLKLLYMQNHLGEKYRAIISGVTDFAFFIELLELFISGSVPLELLEDDYYLFDPKHHRVIGEISGKIYQIGDIIEVSAVEVDKNNNRVIFMPSS